MEKEQITAIAERWDGVSKGFKQLTFEEAQADMATLLAEVRAAERLKSRIVELEAHVKKRNNDMQAFVAEVARLAHGKYSDYMSAEP
jgi:cell division protein FtsB